MNKVEKHIKTKIGEITIISWLGKGKSGYSYLCNLNDRLLVYKSMHKEQCSYYSFNKNKVFLEVESYNVLSKLGINIPKLICYDEQENYLIKEYIEGEIASKIIAQGLSEKMLFELFNMFDIVKKHGFNLDYFPANFVFSNDRLIYIDYELNKYDEKWDLPNWGIYYWANYDGMKQFLKTNDPRWINDSIEEGIPIKNNLDKIVRQWIIKYNIQSI